MPALPTETSTTTTTDKIAEAIKFGRKTRWNPLRFFSGEALGRALDSFESGDLREAAQFFKVIAERDDTISGVKSKREKAVAHKPFNVVTLDDSPEAEKQREVLEGFWRRAKWVDAWDRSQKGKLPRLIKAMQEAVSYKYSVHHIVWQPNARGELSATFEHVPLWFFENREAEMRFLASGFGIAGEPMAETDWLISTGDALMIACSIGYAAKRLSMMDWLRFSEKFSIPGVVGKTASAMGSAQGLAMKDAVTNFGNDYSSVIYGADGSETIELIEANGNPSAMPMPALIEMVNRKFAALYRGADLSTMSSGTGDGAGASLQGDEGEILERDDAASRSEDLQRIEATVLKWYFGEDVEILAEGRIHAPEKEDQAMLLAATKQFVEMGAKLGREEMLARFGLSEAMDGEVTFETPGRDAPPGRPLPDTIPAINANLPEAGDIMLTAASELVALARREDTAALQGRLRDVLSEASPQMMQVKLAALNADLPKFLEASPAMDSAWERIYLTAISEGWAEEPSGKAGVNAFDPSQPRNPKGSDGGGRWVSDGDKASPKVNITGGTDVKRWLEDLKKEWVDATMESQTNLIERDEGEWEVMLADGSRETFASEAEGQSRIDQEREWFESAKVVIDGDEGYVIDDNGTEIIRVVKDDRGWVSKTGDEIDLNEVQSDASPAFTEKLESLFSRMPIDSADVTASDGYADFVAVTGGSRPYVIKGSINGDVINVETMMPDSGAQKVTGSSTGVDLLASLVESGHAEGFSEIRTTGGKADNMTGYKTWPALGFDAPIADSQYGSSLLEITTTPAGRRWWKASGGSKSMVFNLSKSSQSMSRFKEVMERHLSRRKRLSTAVVANSSRDSTGRFNTLEQLWSSDVVFNTPARNQRNGQLMSFFKKHVTRPLEK